MCSCTLYDSGNIDSLVWTEDSNSQRVREYFIPLIKNGVGKYIKNINTKLYILKIDDLVLPVTFNDAEYNQCYACSLYDFYISYLITELRFLKKPLLEKILTSALMLTGEFLKVFKINKAVCVNNWLFSTNLYPEISQEQVSRITEFLKHKFPGHMIIFRSLNHHIYGSLFNNLLENNYEKLASRRVFILDKNFPENKRDIKKDYLLAQNTDYSITDKSEVNDKNIPRLIDLYNYLYINKYSSVNQQYTEDFFALVLRSKALEIKAIQKENRIDAVIAYFSTNDVMAVPIVGYDTSIPKKDGLYRLATTVMYREAKRLGAIFNQSSGVASFKMARGARPEIEYSAIYYRHLPLYRRVFWDIFKSLINKFGPNIIKWFDL